MQSVEILATCMGESAWSVTRLLDEVLIALHAAEDDVSAAAAAGGARGPVAIILEPARDLAEQTHDCIVQFKVCRPSDLRIRPFHCSNKI